MKLNVDRDEVVKVFKKNKQKVSNNLSQRRRDSYNQYTDELMIKKSFRKDWWLSNPQQQKNKEPEKVRKEWEEKLLDTILHI